MLPKTLTPSASLIIQPAYILSVSISVGGITVELINVYLHPEHVGSLAKTLLKHLRTDTSRCHPFRIIGGDFNQLHTKPIFQDILTELDSPPPPLIPTFRKSNGYSSPLDLFLFQLPPSTYSMTTPKFTTFCFFCLMAAWLNEVVVRAVALLSALTKEFTMHIIL